MYRVSNRNGEMSEMRKSDFIIAFAPIKRKKRNINTILREKKIIGSCNNNVHPGVIDTDVRQI